MDLKKFRNISFAILIVLLIILIIIAVLSYVNRDISNSSAFFAFAVRNHISIMVGLVIISIAFGFVWASISYSEIKKSNYNSKKLFEVFYLFLNADEKNILNFLLDNKGKTTQAKISKLENMTRVKAFRTLQKMQEKNLIDIEPQGKVRIIKLKESIMNTISEF